MCLSNCILQRVNLLCVNYILIQSRKRHRNLGKETSPPNLVITTMIKLVKTITHAAHIMCLLDSTVLDNGLCHFQANAPFLPQWSLKPMMATSLHGGASRSPSPWMTLWNKGPANTHWTSSIRRKLYFINQWRLGGCMLLPYNLAYPDECYLLLSTSPATWILLLGTK